METLQAGRTDPWYMLDNAQACVTALAQQQTPAPPTVPPLEPEAYARTVQIPSLAAGPAAARPDLQAASTPRRRRSLPRPRRAARRRSSPPIRSCMKLFIEEAQEELAKIQRRLPGVGPEPARARCAGHRAPLLPYPQGQRPHGRRARAGRVRLVDREPAEPPARQHPDALARDPRDAARRRCRRCPSWSHSSPPARRGQGRHARHLPRARMRWRPAGPRQRRAARKRRKRTAAAPPAAPRDRLRRRAAPAAAARAAAAAPGPATRAMPPPPSRGGRAGSARHAAAACRGTAPRRRR